jgi:hypothetical protein
MLVYLFRERRNAELALTRDVTGRNLPSAPSSEWTFVKALEIKKYRVDPASLTTWSASWSIRDIVSLQSRLSRRGLATSQSSARGTVAEGACYDGASSAPIRACS